MPALTLTHPEATPTQLKAALASTKEHRKQLRLLALLKLQEGKKISAIAEFFGVHRTTVPEWIKRVNAEGLAGLDERSGRGRPARLTNDQRVALRDQLQSPPSKYGLTGNLWTGKLLRDHIAAEFGVHYQLAAMYLLFKELGFTLQRPTKQHLGANPEQQAEFKALVKKNLD